MTDTVRVGHADLLAATLLAYAVALAAFLLVPPYLGASVGPPAEFTLQEAIDLFTPLVVIPLAWWAIALTGGLGRVGTVAFLVAAALWIEGQGIHLAANGINDAVPDDARTAFEQTEPGDVALWLDEVLSHWMWHAGWLALSGLMLSAATVAEAPAGGRTSTPAAVAGAIHGAAFFVVTVEGATTILAIPGTVVLLAWSALAGRRGRLGQPIVPFFLVSSVVALVAYAGWAALNGGRLPEFTEVGLFG